MDEISKQLVEETRQPRPAIPQHPLAYDHEYRRNGVSNLFMLFAPLRAPGRVATGGSHRKTDQSGLGAGGAETGGRGLSPQGTDRAWWVFRACPVLDTGWASPVPSSLFGRRCNCWRRSRAAAIPLCHTPAAYPFHRGSPYFQYPDYLLVHHGYFRPVLIAHSRIRAWVCW